MSDVTTPAIDWDTYEPTAAVRKAAILLSSADTVDATCFGWVPQAREALVAALDVNEMARAMVDHRRIPPYNEDVARCSCGDSYNTRIGAAEHVASAIRTVILGSD